MSKMVCRHCGSQVGFFAVCSSSNPFKINCIGCENKIVVNLSAAIFSALLVAVAVIGILFVDEHYSLGNKFLLLSIIIMLIIFEYCYYQGIGTGFIKSSLVDAYNARDASNEGSAYDAQGNELSIVPRLKNVNYIRHLKDEHNMADDDIPYTSPFVGDLLLSYAFDTNSQFIAVSPNTAAHFGLKGDTWQDTAKMNTLPSLSRLKYTQQGEMYFISAEDNMAACTLLWPELWDQIERDNQLSVAVAALHRDVVIFVDKDNQQAIQELTHYLSEYQATDNHELSKLIFERHGFSWGILRCTVFKL
ncbi:DUF1444 family protein [Shewanella baltica]|uniref:DUF1444 family protein n=1 Tax=Shewanella baltica TaxID=62322 RepID=UPI002871D0F4|nr:DUF1444 family protein [Shewanella baltica]MDR9768324.1 DUF1444 family protein [Shewanella baltica]